MTPSRAVGFEELFDGGDSMSNDDADLISRLFMEEIPEVAAGLVEISGIARKPGYRCKIAVYSHDPNVDCIGVCVGVRGTESKTLLTNWTVSVWTYAAGTSPRRNLSAMPYSLLKLILLFYTLTRNGRQWS